MISLGHRLLKGDNLLINEWNTTQFIGIFYVPFIFIYTSIKGSTEGLILFCRLVYVAWWILVGVLLYKRQKQFGWISIISMTIFLLYTPLDEMSLTYNALCFSFLLVFLSYFFTEGNAFGDYINGIVLVCIVLAYPTALVVYFAYALMVIIKNIFRINTNTKLSRMLSWKVFLRIISFSAFIAVVFFILLCIIGISDIFTSIKSILLFQAEKESIIRKLINLVLGIYQTLPIQSVLGLLCLVISIIDRNRNKRVYLYLLIQTVLFTISVVWILKSNLYGFNIIMIPLIFPGLQAIVLIKQRNYTYILTFVLFGVIFAICSYFTSDTGLLAFSNGMAITDFAWILYIYQLCSENKLKRKNILSLSLAILIVFQIGSEFYLKLMRYYWDEITPNLNSVIQSGAAKGIITTKKNSELYNKVLEDIQTIRTQTNGNEELGFLSLSLFPSAYLDMNYNYSTFSSWTYSNNGLNFSVLNDKLSLYFTNTPNKVPDIIYILNEDKQHLNKIKCLDYNDYQEIILESGVAYIKKK